jgi:hypothetical protein
MSIIRFSIQLSVPAAQGMGKEILKEFSNHITNAINGAVPSITTKVNQLISEEFRKSDIWNAITIGDLQNLLLIPSASSALYSIERAIINGVTITRVPVAIAGQYINGGFSISFLDDNYLDVLSAGNTSYVTTNGKYIPWLEWLLYYGDSPVLRRAKLIKTNAGPLLIKSDSDLQIPSAYSGIPSDNFLTRTLIPLESKIGSMIEEEISRRA